MTSVSVDWSIPAISVSGRKEDFPVRRIFCVGRNYAAHAREMGLDPEREPPFFFTKFPEAIAANGETIPYPLATASLHHEVELVVAIGREGMRIPKASALEHVYGYAVGLDMTRRDLQLAARDLGRPWDVGKNFPSSAPIGALSTVDAVGHLREGAIWLTLDGSVKQSADLSELIWNTGEIIEHLSALYRLLPGDIVMTGTPAGVGPVLPGQTLTAHIDGLEELSVFIGQAEA